MFLGEVSDHVHSIKGGSGKVLNPYLAFLLVAIYRGWDRLGPGQKSFVSELTFSISLWPILVVRRSSKIRLFKLCRERSDVRFIVGAPFPLSPCILFFRQQNPPSKTLLSVHKMPYHLPKTWIFGAIYCCCSSCSQMPSGASCAMVQWA